MATLTKKKLAELHKLLEQESFQITGIIENLEEQDSTWATFSTSDQRSRDALEADPAARERDILTALTMSAASGSDEIRRALEKFSEGSYGLCDDCGGKIPVERLEARPRSVLCVKCA